VLLTPPDLGEAPEDARLTRLTHTTLLTGMVLSLVLGPLVTFLLSPKPVHSLVLNVFILAGFVVLLGATRRGHARAASWLVVGLLWVYLSFELWWFGGLRAPMLATFFSLVLIAVLLLDPRGAVVAVSLTLVTTLAALLAEGFGILPSAVSPSALRIWIMFLVNLVAVVVLAQLSSSELRRANRALRAQIEKRRRDEEARQRLEEQLRQSQKLEAVGRLAGGVAHDFNNVLMIITGHGELVRRGLAPDDPRRLKLDDILDATERASKVVRQLLAFSRGQTLDLREVQLNDLVSQATKLLDPALGEGITCTTRLDPRLGRVLVDPGQIEQVLLNLAMNARDAMPAGGTLEIETSNRDVDAGLTVPPGRYVVLSVRDKGAGMDAETRGRIFEPFFTTKKEGTGLGLAMAYGIVQQCGGHIAIESEPGRGTVFHLHLPRL
jgi:signal transduction histidine kinase